MNKASGNLCISLLPMLRIATDNDLVIHTQESCGHSPFVIAIESTLNRCMHKPQCNHGLDGEHRVDGAYFKCRWP